MDNFRIPLSLVDAHAHMSDDAFANGLERVLARAAAQGVQAIVSVSETVNDARHILALVDRYPLIKPCAGLYPTHLDPREVLEMQDLIREHRDRLAAIGEVGLDYWIAKDSADRAVQRELLVQQIRLAQELELPLNVHSRSAGRHVIALLREYGARFVLLHAFDGKVSAAMAGIEAGYYFSIPPSVVRSRQKQKLVQELPLERLLLESDSPVLGPTKDERNEPANVRLACDYIASVRNLPIDEVALVTTENARRVFPQAFM